MKERRKAREIALAFLYQWEVRGDEVLAEMEDVLLKDRRSEECSSYARDLVRGAIERREELDRLLSEAAEHWRIERMAAVDRNLLRMGVLELLWKREDAPPKVAINEAIELAKRFSTENSGAFVNGVLDRVRRNLGL
jgi:transcription antitermination factor NusB